MPDLIKEGMDVLPTAIDSYNKSIEEDEIASKIDSEFAAGAEAEIPSYSNNKAGMIRSMRCLTWQGKVDVSPPTSQNSCFKSYLRCWLS